MSERSVVSACGFGMSTNTDAALAVQEAVAAADVSNATVAFVSCTVAHDVTAVADAFAKALPSTGIHGVTSSGALLASSGPCAGVGCLLINAPNAFVTAHGENGVTAAKALQELCQGKGDVAAVVMATTPGAEEGVLSDLADEFPGVRVIGGTAADNDLDGSWRLLSSSGVQTTGVSLVAVMSGKVRMGASLVDPYTPTDKTVKVSKAEGRKVFALDDKPASDWVLQWLGDDVKEQYKSGGLVLPATAQRPIGIKQKSGKYLPIHLAGLNTDKSVDFFTPVQTGDVLTVMDSGDGPSTGYAQTLADAFDVAMADGGLKKPKAGVLLYCGGMAIAVGDNLAKGLQSDGFASRVTGMPLLGITVFGEQGRMEEVGNVQRNLSMGMLLLE